MASVRATRDGISTPLQQWDAVFEDIEPSHAWTEDLNGHYLLVDLPDFKKAEVKIQVINSGIIKVNGKRLINEKKHIRFEQTFKVPANTDANAISAKFDGETQILYVTIPKQKMIEEKREPEPEPHTLKDQQNDNDNDNNGATQQENVHKKIDSGKVDQERGANEGRGHENAPTSYLNENVGGWEYKPRYYYLRNAIDILAKNKRVVVTALLAFSLGMFISHKFESNED